MITNYQTISYPFKIGEQTVYKQVTDITTNVRIQEELAKSLSVYNYKTLQEGETPEMTAFQDYGNAKLHYLVMLANELYDWRECYPLTDLELDSYISEKYINPDNVHHYEDVNGNVVDNGVGAFTIPITNEEYERGLNDAKRYIKTIKEQYTQQVVDTLKHILEQMQ